MTTQGTVSRLPVPAAIHTALPVGSIDVLPQWAATHWPHRTALRADGNAMTFAELDRAVSRLASGLREQIGGEGSVVAVSSLLGLDFPVAYYAIARSGNVIAPVNPRLGADVLEQLLISIGARAVVLSRAMYDRVRSMLVRLPLEQVLLLDGSGDSTCADLAGRGDLLVDPRDRNENVLGAIGSTRHTHYGLKVDAANAVAAHGLSGDAVVFNALPSYPQSQLNAAVWAGATQVLCASPDVEVQARIAMRHNATHCYTIDRMSWPAEARLNRIAS